MTRKRRVPITVGYLAPGTLFEVKDGLIGLKTAYESEAGECECFALLTGERMHFENGNDEPVLFVRNIGWR